jgi:hypothetical protein
MKKTPFIGLIAALSLIFISCDNKNNLPDNESSDKDVAVRICSLSVAEGGSESLTRSSLEKEPEIVSQPIGHGMLLEMSVKQDDFSLRAPQLLGNGKLFRVIAVNHGTSNYHSHGDFTVGISSPSNDFHVRIGEKYDYICLSLNSDTDLPPSSGYTVGSALSSLAFDNEDDLLWCKIEDDDPVTSAGVDLNIVLKRRLTKLKVKLDCSYNKWKIGVGNDKVSIKDVATNGSINLSTGDVTGSSPAPQTFTSFTSIVGATSQASEELTIMPKASSTITITILADAVSRDDLSTIPAGEKTPTLITALSAGVSYTITVRLRTPIFARSNIYWDATTDPTNPKLTFVPAADDPAQNDDTKAGYQGVFFKWGSLVGISPARTGSSNYFSGSTPLYIPVVKDPLNTSTWKATTGDNTASDTDIDESVRHNYTSWSSGAYNVYDETPKRGDIPYMDPSRVASGGTTFLMNAVRNNLDTSKGLLLHK